ncbi:F0F1 ATP synthase subunit delta [Pseudobacteroides cellulosolvens]|uniref:ATP synthase subunit delta n=1 Tax=Pseudobacteroides cellulosolvens ATCC 35603 = DSM 2933 TaxID=398512 RepID=A0A0L6JRP3_9FIRM|nr:F0F1 ATP synthase subunit delta [Pseudobacteroides cellulosolvens]KNY28511.1 ATP synthase subunit delta [Pseudobacteroides cellulosolvens ATCC 35603 = DSM 2933]
MPLIDKRYAEALVEIADNANAIDEFQHELVEIIGIYKDQQDFRLFLNNPEVKIDTKKETLKSIFSKDLRPEILNFLLLLLDKDRIKHLPGINDEFIKLADIKRNTLNMTIISAAELDELQITKIKEKYGKLYSATSVKASVEIDQSLIGGVKVKIGDKVIDGSVKGRLESIKELLG